MSSRLEKQDADDVVHSLLALALVVAVFFGYHIGAKDKQQEIEDRVKSTQMTIKENARVEIILFGETQK